MNDYAVNRMKATIDRLLKEAPKLDDAGDTIPANGKRRAPQAPAVEAHVVLRSGQQIHGALSTCVDGVGLRMLAMNKTPAGTVVAVESFFDYAEVSCISVLRPVTSDAPEHPSPIIHTS